MCVVWWLFLGLLSPSLARHTEPSKSAEFPWGFADYNGPNVWDRYFPRCGGPNQSPVALGRPDRYASQPKGLNNYSIPKEMSVTGCDGHYIEICVNEDKSLPIPDSAYHSVNEQYNLFSCHLHWGKDNQRGSYHSIDGKHYPMSMSCGFFNKKYKSPLDANMSHEKFGDGRIENIYFFKVGDYNKSPVFEELFELIRSINGTDRSAVFRNADKLPNWNIYRESDYYSYKGSIMHPACWQARTNVFTQEIEMSESQLSFLRSIVNKNGESYFANRPIQPLNQRKVTYVRREPSYGGHEMKDRYHEDYDRHYDGRYADDDYLYDRRPLDYGRRRDIGYDRHHDMGYDRRDLDYDRLELGYDRHSEFDRHTMDQYRRASDYPRRPVEYERHESYDLRPVRPSLGSGY